jgi:hypothetical protein
MKSTFSRNLILPPGIVLSALKNAGPVRTLKAVWNVSVIIEIFQTPATVTRMPITQVT